MIKVEIIQESQIGKYDIIEKNVPTLSELIAVFQDLTSSKKQIIKIEIHGKLTNELK